MVTPGLSRTSPAWAPVHLALLGALALAGWLGWKAYGPHDPGDPVAASLVALERHNRLTVFSAQLAPVVVADDERLFGMLKSRQVAIIPARVDYSINLEMMDRSRLVWDEPRQHLTITLPPLQLSRPNLDEAHAQYLREGVWITGDAQAKLTRDNTLTAERQANEQARNPVLLDLARQAARAAMEQNLAIPLQVAGHGEAEVEVRFDGEPTSS